MTEKLHKVLARAGLGSRRHIEQWIQQGRVTVNGEVAVVGSRVTEHDRLAVDGQPVDLVHADVLRVLLYHKPLGELVTRHDPRDRRTVFESLPQLAGGRWIAVGRLDINTTGLMLFTNDGELANKLMHPRANLEREYVARVHGVVDGEKMEKLKTGVDLNGRPAAFTSIVPVGDTERPNRRFRVVLTEGRNREVRRLWEAVGAPVNRLKRIRFGPIKLPRDLKPGHWRELSTTEIRKLSPGL